jgi:hypothetical protein
MEYMLAINLYAILGATDADRFAAVKALDVL